MPDRLNKTFEYLERSANPRAVDVLLHALDVRPASIAHRAVVSLCRRHDPHLHVELVRRFEKLPPAQQNAILRVAPTFQAAVEECLQSEDEALRTAALAFVRAAGGVACAEAVLQLAAEDDFAEPAMQIVRGMVERCCVVPGEAAGASSRPDAREVARETRRRAQDRRHLLQAIVHSLPRLRESPVLRDVIEFALVLGEPADAGVRRMLTDTAEPFSAAAWQLLTTGTDPSLVRFLARAAGSDAFADRIVDIIEQRDDPEFVVQWLRALPESFTKATKEAFRRIDRLKWFDETHRDVDWVPAALQGKLVSFLSATSVREDWKLSLYQWMLRHGSVAGRSVAAEFLAAIDEGLVESAISEGLQSQDVELQAWATSQLRHFEVPEAFSHLIARLDSPADEVRKAARAELAGFRLLALLPQFDSLSPQGCRNAGELLRKVDSGWQSDLVRELHSPVRQKRVRAIRAARAFGLHRDLVSELLELLADPDVIVRRTAIDAVCDVPSSSVAGALSRLLQDDSPRIRNAAKAALTANEQARAAERH